MKKFKILTIFGSFLVGIPAIMAIIVVFSSIKNYNRHELEGLYRIPKPKTTPDTIVVEKIVEKMCHAPAECFRLKDRGYLEEGKWADLVIFDLNDSYKVAPQNIQYKCGWSPFEGHTFESRVSATVVSGSLAFLDGLFFEDKMGERLLFERER